MADPPNALQVNETAKDISALSKSDPNSDKTSELALQVYQDLEQLYQSDPGTGRSSAWRANLQALNDKLAKEQILPGLEIAGIDQANKQIIMRDSRGVERSIKPIQIKDPPRDDTFGATNIASGTRTYGINGRSAVTVDYEPTEKNPGGEIRKFTLNGNGYTRQGDTFRADTLGGLLPWDHNRVAVLGDNGSVEFRDPVSRETELFRNDGSVVKRDGAGRVTDVRNADGKAFSVKYVENSNVIKSVTNDKGFVQFDTRNGVLQEFELKTIKGQNGGTDQNVSVPTGRTGEVRVDKDGTTYFDGKDSKGYSFRRTLFTDGSSVESSHDKIQMVDKRGLEHEIRRRPDGKVFARVTNGDSVTEREVAVIDDALGTYSFKDNMHVHGAIQKRDGSVLTLNADGRIARVDYPKTEREPESSRAFVYDREGELETIYMPGNQIWKRGEGIAPDGTPSDTWTCDGQPTKYGKAKVDALGNLEFADQTIWTDGRVDQVTLKAPINKLPPAGTASPLATPPAAPTGTPVSGIAK